MNGGDGGDVVSETETSAKPAFMSIAYHTAGSSHSRRRLELDETKPLPPVKSALEADENDMSGLWGSVAGGFATET